WVNIELLNQLKDSETILKSIDADEKNNQLSSLEVGSYITFGSYEQDNDMSNGKEDIEWLVLAKEDNKVLVISKYGLDCETYNTPEKATWETCTLRGWLNETFYRSAFSKEERERILLSRVKADNNPEYDTSPGKDTMDKVFLLSIEEANKYFDSDSERQCKGTSYCLAQSTFVWNEGIGTWWLRTPGSLTIYTAEVAVSGHVINSGSTVYNSSTFVRPALWLDLDISIHAPLPIQIIQNPKGKCTANKVNIREKPEMGGRSLGVLNKGDSLEILSVNGEWCEIQTAEKTGYIKTQYIDFGEEKSDSFDLEVESQEVRTIEGNSKDELAEGKGTEVGSYIFFGTYEQDNDTSNGVEPIEWIVLAKEGNKALIISKYVLDNQKFNDTSIDVTWETCSLRKWLNETFFQSAFSDEEQGRILSSAVTVDKSQAYVSLSGNNTIDKIFLLSVSDVDNYFIRDSDRRCQGTPYSYKQGAYRSQFGHCMWWLRSSGRNGNTAALVYGDMNFKAGYSFGQNVTKEYGIRPSLWISLE
ncbi:MAG: SH3 domain-containing protein, partial [Clostridia bacterium]|nr:SH3 domain-containing protein [Clostridia bacterium]